MQLTLKPDKFIGMFTCRYASFGSVILMPGGQIASSMMAEALPFGPSVHFSPSGASDWHIQVCVWKERDWSVGRIPAVLTNFLCGFVQTTIGVTDSVTPEQIYCLAV